MYIIAFIVSDLFAFKNIDDNIMPYEPFLLPYALPYAFCLMHCLMPYAFLLPGS